MKNSSYHSLLSFVCAIGTVVFLYFGQMFSVWFLFALTLYNELKAHLYRIEEELKKEEDETL
jgi:hypothetical protein